MIVQNSALSVYYPLAEALSRNALIQTGALSYNEPILVDEGLKSSNVRKFGIRPVEENNQELLKVYPNPAKEYFVTKVELSGNRGLLQLVSSTGVIVLERIVEQSSSLTIPVSHLADGVYTIHLTVNGVHKASIKITLQ